MEKYTKYPCSKTCVLVFEQGHLSRKNLSRAIFASVNYLSSALVNENCHIFRLPRKTCLGKTCQGELAKENLLVCTVNKFSLTDKGTCLGKLASVNEALL